VFFNLDRICAVFSFFIFLSFSHLIFILFFSLLNDVVRVVVYRINATECDDKTTTLPRTAIPDGLPGQSGTNDALAWSQ
jgi:hypothetical protein